MSKEVQVNIQSNTIQVMCQANGTMALIGSGKGLINLTLRDGLGQIELKLPPEVFPFISQGDVVLCTISIVKAIGTIVEPDPILGAL